MKSNLLKILSITVFLVLMFGLTGYAATIPNGKGVQKMNPGLETGFYIKGVYTPAIFDIPDVCVKVGTWVTIGFGVFDPAVPNDVPVEDAAYGFQAFIHSFYWSIVFDGEDITEGVLNGGVYDDPIVFDNGDGTYYILVAFRYYIIPQAKGDYNLYGFVGFDANNPVIPIRDSTITWHPKCPE